MVGRFRQHRKDVVDSAVRRHRGRIVDDLSESRLQSRPRTERQPLPPKR
jgi:hypothetical protein